MKYLYAPTLVILLLLAHIPALTQQLIYPSSPKDSVTDNYFGATVSDPYRWLENETSEKTKEWVSAQSELSGTYLRKLLNKYPFENHIRFNSYMQFGRMPFGSLQKEGHFFVDFIAYETQKTASLYLSGNIIESPVLAVDPADYKNNSRDIVSITGYGISRNDKYIAFALSYNGTDWREIRVKTVFPFKQLPDRLRWVKFSSIQWKGDGFFYCTYDSVGQSEMLTAVNQHPKIFYHQLGTTQNEDQLVFADSTGTNTSLRFSVTGDERYLVINHEIRYKSKSYQKVSFIDFQKDSHTLNDLIFSPNYYQVIGLFNGKFLVSSHGPTPNGALSLVSPDEPDQLEEFIPEHKEILKKTTIVGDKIICIYLDDIDNIAITYNKDGKAVNKIACPVGSSLAGFDGAPEDPKTVFFYQSFIHPPIAYLYDVTTLQVKVIQMTQVLYDLSDFEVRKVYYFSKDGQKIPMIIAGKKGFKLDGNNPTILYGYGGYGISMTPVFEPGFINHLENGGLLALPSLRGGGEYGEQWHAEGMLSNKQNVFNDFIAAAEYLKNQHYTCKEKLAIMGGSNGGLLIGAVLDQRPDLCQVAVAEKGIFDMLRYQKFTIGSAWIDEFGTSDDSAQFNYLYKYSPLQNVRNLAYPATLIITADHDDRVVPMHSYKFVAALQEKNTGNTPILLLTEKNYGHVDDNTKAEAAKYAFIYEHLGVPAVSLPLSN
ncbi:MAG TPA: prolyl oligopeptidase family serine peptidase [Puia sp.]|nr:prolyl oligopeptidase family serine peptidase [Puia sp.]